MFLCLVCSPLEHLHHFLRLVFFPRAQIDSTQKKSKLAPSLNLWVYTRALNDCFPLPTPTTPVCPPNFDDSRAPSSQSVVLCCVVLLCVVSFVPLVSLGYYYLSPPRPEPPPPSPIHSPTTLTPEAQTCASTTQTSSSSSSTTPPRSPPPTHPHSAYPSSPHQYPSTPPSDAAARDERTPRPRR